MRFNVLVALTKTAISPGEIKSMRDVYDRLGKGAEEKLNKAGLNTQRLHEGDPEQVEKLVELYVKGAKKEKSFWLKMLDWVATSVGAASFGYIMALLITGGPKGSPSTAVAGTTTPGGA
ncbi:unnamed protein product [Peronospora destructor]|uniref:Uncharacterized protein n=1 Tax=Peronospora destructor TaxID=86335 RepID=A0AAV0SWR2_9STRA|nr:unnamed protein product [Peronospora destructor]